MAPKNPITAKKSDGERNGVFHAEADDVLEANLFRGTKTVLHAANNA